MGRMGGDFYLYNETGKLCEVAEIPMCDDLHDPFYSLIQYS